MTSEPELSLDPDDWDEFAVLCQQILTDLIDFQKTVRDRPVWTPVPQQVIERLRTSLPLAPNKFSDIYDEFKQCILPYPLGNGHPRHWGWVNGTGTPIGMMADLMASAMNANVWGNAHSATYVEEQVLTWLKAIMAFPESAGGLLVSGASEANLNALTVARNVKSGWDVRALGLAGGPMENLRVYASQEVHACIPKTLEILGLGRRALQTLVTEDFRLNARGLAEQIEADKRAGLRPMAVIATIGTVTTGAIDPLPQIAEICRMHDVWLHVDGAFGALARLSRKYRHLADGLEQADSVAFDLHKWAYQPYDVGCVLVRTGSDQVSAFDVAPSYLSRLEGGITGSGANFSNHGIQLSRAFRALKIWFAFKTHGADALGQLIEQNIDQASYLAELVRGTEDLELLCEGPLNVVNFRYAPPGWDSAALDKINKKILVALQSQGIAAPSSAVLDGCFAIRVAIVNHRSTRADFETLVDSVQHLGNSLISELTHGA